jgi:hypothetical protein
LSRYDAGMKNAPSFLIVGLRACALVLAAGSGCLAIAQSPAAHRRLADAKARGE